jgi:hypothetical protein
MTAHQSRKGAKPGPKVGTRPDSIRTYIYQQAGLPGGFDPRQSVGWDTKRAASDAMKMKLAGNLYSARVGKGNRYFLDPEDARIWEEQAKAAHAEAKKAAKAAKARLWGELRDKTLAECVRKAIQAAGKDGTTTAQMSMDSGYTLVKIGHAVDREKRMGRAFAGHQSHRVVRYFARQEDAQAFQALHQKPKPQAPNVTIKAPEKAVWANQAPKITSETKVTICPSPPLYGPAAKLLHVRPEQITNKLPKLELGKSL